MEQENQLLERTLTSMKKEAYQEAHRIEVSYLNINECEIILQRSFRIQVLREEVNRLKEEAYRVKFSVEEKEIVSKDNMDEVEKLVKKISRAKELNQQMQKLARRAKKAKGKLNEEVCLKKTGN